MEVEGVGLEQRGAVALGAHPLRIECALVDEAPVHAKVLFHQALLAPQDGLVVEPVGQQRAAFDGLAVDRVARDALPDQVHRRARQRIDGARTLRPELGQQVGAV